MQRLSIFGVMLIFTFIILQVSSKKKHKVSVRHHIDFKYCMDNYLFPRFFKTFCPGKGERWLKARAAAKERNNVLINPELAKSFAKVVKRAVVSHGTDSGEVFVREDFYNGYREECCQKGCRLEESLEFCNTLT